MLRGLRTGLKYFTLGLLAGMVFAPRKGSDTFKMLIGRSKEYVSGNLNITESERRGEE